jgi:7-keto-8-aminopelargonate synthetase-like enzyme
LAALGVLRSAEGAVLLARVRNHVERLVDAGLGELGHPSPIVPVVIGAEQAALDASTTLLAQGLWVPAIRPPTVPPGTSRLRVTVSAAHGDGDVSRLVESLLALRRVVVPTPA